MPFCLVQALAADCRSRQLRCANTHLIATAHVDPPPAPQEASRRNQLVLPTFRRLTFGLLLQAALLLTVLAQGASVRTPQLTGACAPQHSACWFSLPLCLLRQPGVHTPQPPFCTRPHTAFWVCRASCNTSNQKNAPHVPTHNQNTHLTNQ